MILNSLNVSLPQSLKYGDWQVETSGNKQSIASAMLHFNDFEGNAQADLVNHGGPDKAVCVYPQVHYPFWETMLGKSLSPGAFSENFTLAGDDALETNVCIGDIWQVGEAIVQVAGPRMPCRKLAARLGNKRVIEWCTGKGYTGYYLRVLQESLVSAGATIRVLEQSPTHVSVDAVNNILYHRERNPKIIAALLASPGFSEGGKRWIEEIVKREPAWMDEVLRAQVRDL